MSMIPSTLRDYRWGHAVNSHELLQDISSAIRAATAAPPTKDAPLFVNAVEADVIWSETQQVAVMGHPPQTDSDLTLTAFLDEMQSLASLLSTHSNYDATSTDANPPLIVKLDFKSMHAFNGSGNLVRAFIAVFPFARGVFINADILVGPANTSAIAFPDADAFVRDASALATNSTDAQKLVLSVGWTTSNDTEEEWRRAYTPAMIDAMLAVLAPYPHVRVTFPLRAPSVRSSWTSLQRLLQARDARHAFGFTLWWAKTQLPDDELAWLVETLEHDANNKAFANRTFYDILGFADFEQRRLKGAACALH